MSFLPRGGTGATVMSAGTTAQRRTPFKIGQFRYNTDLGSLELYTGSTWTTQLTPVQTSVSGNAGSATALETARNINGVSFNGTADITVTAAAGTLTGATLAAGVTASSLTSVGTIATGVWNGTVVGSAFGGTGVDNGARTLTINTNSGTISFTNAGTTLTVAATASVSGTNTGDQTTVTGNAGTATTLQTARNINGVSFNGSADITVTAAAGTLTGATLNATVTGSSLTSVGTIGTGTWQAGVISSTYGGTGVNNGGRTLTLNTNNLTIAVTNPATTLTVAGASTSVSGTNTGDQTSVSGNAGTATVLQTARNINGVSFNGSADITVTAAAGTLTGATLNATVTGSSLTSVGTIGTGTWQGGVINSTYGGTGVNNAGRTLTINTNSGTISFTGVGTTLTVAATGSVSGTNTGDQTTISGNAGTATTLQTARNINGVSFNGSADITVTAAAGTLTGASLAAGVTGSSLTSVGTLSALAVTGTHTQTGTINLAGTTSPIQLQGSAGTSGQVLTSAGAGATPTWVTLGGGTGTVTSVTVTQPAAGITVTNSGVAQTPTATSTIALANDLAAVEGLATTGIVRRTGTDTWSAGTAVSLTTEVTGNLPFANIAQIGNNTIAGNVSGSTGDITALTGTQVTAMLDNFTSTLKGLVPLSGGGTTNFLRADGTWAAAGGGSPGGSDTQIQFNNAGAFGGDADFTWNSSTNDLILGGTDTGITLQGITNEPSVPSAGRGHLYAKDIGGRVMPKWIGPSGIDFPLQPHVGVNKISWWQAAGNSTTITAIGAGSLTATGTATTANVATTNIHTYARRVEFLVTTAATTAVAGWRNPTAMWSIGAAIAGQGGFHHITRWGPATGVATTTNRAFVGMTNSTAAPTDVEPSSITNMCGMGWDAADTNIQFMYRGAGAVTKVDLGANFPVPTADRTKLYEIVMFALPGTTQSLSYRVVDLGTGATATGTITTGLPTTTTLLTPRGWMSVGGTSSVIGIAMVSVYVETDY